MAFNICENIFFVANLLKLRRNNLLRRNHRPESGHGWRPPVKFVVDSAGPRHARSQVPSATVTPFSSAPLLLWPPFGAISAPPSPAFARASAFSGRDERSPWKLMKRGHRFHPLSRRHCSTFLQSLIVLFIFSNL